MKPVILLLVALNVALLAASSGLFGALGASPREPQRLAHQIRPEQLRVVAAAPAPTPAPAPAPAPGASSSGPGQTGEQSPVAASTSRGAADAGSAPPPGSAVAVPSAPPAVPTPPAAASPAAAGPALPAAAGDPAPAASSAAPATAVTCTEWGLFAEAELAGATAAAERPGTRVEPLRRAAQPGKFMVYLPPLADAQAAQARAGELKQLGVDTYVIRDGPHRMGVSLGVFRQEEGAQTMLRELERRGVTDAQISGRDNDRWALRLHTIGPLPADQRRDLSSQFPQRRFRSCTG